MCIRDRPRSPGSRGSSIAGSSAASPNRKPPTRWTSRRAPSSGTGSRRQSCFVSCSSPDRSNPSSSDVAMSATPHSDDLSKLASLVDVLLDAAPERRASLVEELSAGDPVRRAELERIRQQCEREPTLLSRPAAERFAALFDDDIAGFPRSLAERYRVARELGRGGMATVYLARDLKHGREVAVKVVHPSVASALGPERFLREIAIAAQLHHPHIVQLYDSGAV